MGATAMSTDPSSLVGWASQILLGSSAYGGSGGCVRAPIGRGMG